MAKHVTVSAKIDPELREKLEELGIRPSEAIRRALQREIEEKMKENLQKKIDKANPILSKVSKEAWVKAIRESRDER